MRWRRENERWHSTIKKEYKDLYQPKRMPAIVTVPAMRFVAVDGVGDPNEEGGDYAKAMQLLYGISSPSK